MQMEYYGPIHVFVFGAVFMLLNHNAFATTTAGNDHCQGTNVQTFDKIRCEAFYTCINETWISKSCRYPQLFSNITKECDTFENVDCGKRFVPISPCDYSRTNCIRRSDRQCRCKPENDIDFDMCLNLSDGYYMWPERKWSPYYVQCQGGRTIPSQCSGASVIYDFVHHNCDLIYTVLNFAYTLSMHLHLPASSLSYLDVKSTETRHQTVIQEKSKFSKKSLLIIPSTTYNDLILQTLSILDTFSHILAVYTNEPQTSSLYQYNGQTLPRTMQNVISTIDSKLSTGIPYFQPSSLLWSSYENLERNSNDLQQSKINVNLMSLRETLNKSGPTESFSVNHDSAKMHVPYILSYSFVSGKTVQPSFTALFATNALSEQTIQPSFSDLIATSHVSGHTVQPSVTAVTELKQMSERTVKSMSLIVNATSHMSEYTVEPSSSVVISSSYMSYLTVQPSVSVEIATRNMLEQTAQSSFPAVIASNHMAEQTVQHSFQAVTAPSDISERTVLLSFTAVTGTGDILEQTVQPSLPAITAISDMTDQTAQPNFPAVTALLDISEQTVLHSFLGVTANSDTLEQTIKLSFPAVIALSDMTEQTVQPSFRSVIATSDISEQTVQHSFLGVTAGSDKSEQTVKPSFPAVITLSDMTEQTVQPTFRSVIATSDISETKTVQPSFTAVTPTSDISEQTVQPSFTAVTPTRDMSDQTVEPSFITLNATSLMLEQTVQPSTIALISTRNMSKQTVKASFTASTAIHQGKSVETGSSNNSVGTANLEFISALHITETDETLTVSTESVMRETDYSNILPTATPMYIKSDIDTSRDLPAHTFGHFSKTSLKGNGYKTDKPVPYTSQLLNSKNYFKSYSLDPSFAIKSSVSLQLTTRQFEGSFDISLKSDSTEVKSGAMSLIEINSSFLAQQIPDSFTHFESSFSSARSMHMLVSKSSAELLANAFSDRHQYKSVGNEHISLTDQYVKKEPWPVQTISSTFRSEISTLDSDNLLTVSSSTAYTNFKGYTDSVSVSEINTYKEPSGRTVVPYSVSKASSKIISLVESTSIKYSHSSTSSPSLSDPNTDKTTLIVSFSVTVGGIIVLAILTAFIMCLCKANRKGGANLTEDVDSRLHTIR